VREMPCHSRPPPRFALFRFLTVRHLPRAARMPGAGIANKPQLGLLCPLSGPGLADGMSRCALLGLVLNEGGRHTGVDLLEAAAAWLEQDPAREMTARWRELRSLAASPSLWVSLFFFFCFAFLISLLPQPARGISYAHTISFSSDLRSGATGLLGGLVIVVAQLVIDCPVCRGGQRQ